MKICVCVKQVPDSWAEKKLTASDSTLDRAAADRVVNELDEYAVEEALRIVEAGEGEVTILSMGPDEAADSVRKAISMGAHAGIHISDPALHGSDALATSLVLAKALEGRGFDLIMFGSESTDARMSVVPAMVSARLGLPQMTFANKVVVSGSNLTIHRVTDYGYDEVQSSLPAVVSVVEKTNEPRYPSFKNIMAAKKAPMETLSLADIGLDAATVGLANAWSEVKDFAERPAKAKGTVITDEGNGAEKIEEFLVTQKFI
ncbi:MAG: electron transfer flavoprotein subunit beta/FixA family protein [Actinobacteria bacterium]|nr:electron transfer flavoprotein subunit beta/FixA family protein [Actinomycetota bacterium]